LGVPLTIAAPWSAIGMLCQWHLLCTVKKMTLKMFSSALLITSEKNQRENQRDCPLAWVTVCGQGGIFSVFFQLHW
jgi:hypothetical protein